MVFALPWAFRRRAFGWRSVRPEKRIPQSGIVAAQIEQKPLGARALARQSVTMDSALLTHEQPT